MELGEFTKTIHKRVKNKVQEQVELIMGSLNGDLMITTYMVDNISQRNENENNVFVMNESKTDITDKFITRTEMKTTEMKTTENDESKENVNINERRDKRNIEITSRDQLELKELENTLGFSIINGNGKQPKDNGLYIIDKIRFSLRRVRRLGQRKYMDKNRVQTSDSNETYMSKIACETDFHPGSKKKVESDQIRENTHLDKKENNIMNTNDLQTKRKFEEIVNTMEDKLFEDYENKQIKLGYGLNHKGVVYSFNKKDKNDKKPKFNIDETSTQENKKIIESIKIDKPIVPDSFEPNYSDSKENKVTCKIEYDDFNQINKINNNTTLNNKRHFKIDDHEKNINKVNTFVTEKMINKQWIKKLGFKKQRNSDKGILKNEMSENERYNIMSIKKDDKMTKRDDYDKEKCIEKICEKKYTIQDHFDQLTETYDSKTTKKTTICCKCKRVTEQNNIAAYIKHEEKSQTNNINHENNKHIIQTNLMDRVQSSNIYAHLKEDKNMIESIPTDKPIGKNFDKYVCSNSNEINAFRENNKNMEIESEEEEYENDEDREDEDGEDGEEMKREEDYLYESEEPSCIYSSEELNINFDKSDYILNEIEYEKFGLYNMEKREGEIELEQAKKLDSPISDQNEDVICKDCVMEMILRCDMPGTKCEHRLFKWGLCKNHFGMIDDIVNKNKVITTQSINTNKQSSRLLVDDFDFNLTNSFVESSNKDQKFVNVSFNKITVDNNLKNEIQKYIKRDHYVRNKCNRELKKKRDLIVLNDFVDAKELRVSKRKNSNNKTIRCCIKKNNNKSNRKSAKFCDSVVFSNFLCRSHMKQIIWKT